MIALIAAFLSPFLSAIVNVLDKGIVTRRVKNVFSFAVLMGCAHLLVSIILASFLDWSEVAKGAFFFPLISGFLLGLQVYFYYLVLREEDISHAVGFVYIYPVVVAFLSFVFLGERLSGGGYAGALITVCGALILSRSFQSRRQVTGWLFVIILLIALNDFTIKLSTIDLSALHGVALNGFGVGAALLPALLHTKTRREFTRELPNIPFVLLIEFFGFLGVASLYFAMEGLPAAIVASIGALQPLAVLFFERLGSCFFGKIDKDHLLLPKLVPIATIVLGVVVLYLAELI